MTATNNIMLTPVIMSGGSGTRLWPLSRQTKPKQFLTLTGANSLLQETINRLQGVDISTPYVLCNDEHRFLVAEQLRQIDQTATIILEPEGRNTAPAITLAALQAQKEGRDEAILLVLAADHLIQNKNVFHDCINQAIPLAKQGYLVTFGIVPTKAETGYGYIKKGKIIDNQAYLVDSFVEKPDLNTAQQYVDSDNYCWNSGIFMFRVKDYLQQLKQFQINVYQHCEKAIELQCRDLDFIRVDKTAFIGCPNISIDYAVMEKTDKAVMIPMDANWTDIGSWSALWDVTPKDAQGNSSKGDVLLEQTHNTLVYADHRLVTTLGVKDLIVVETQDAILVAHKDKIQQVKNIVDRLKQDKRSEAITHSEVHRPWGIYNSIDIGDRHLVKRITVKPGSKLSLQMHHHRAEHWVVVKGTAKVTNGDDIYFLTENESTYIPIGQAHCLENPGKIPLEIIEVQSGTYLDEDDIIRLEDRYGR